MKKGTKTTITAIIGAILFMALLGALIFNYIDVQEFTISATSLTAFITFMIGLFSKDYDKSHSIKFADNPPPGDEEEPPGK